MDMNMIMTCSTSACAYNDSGKCHTPAINVGPHAECNAFVHASPKAGFKDVKAGIGACQAAGCSFNDKLECMAIGVNIAGHDRHADCATFMQKK